MDPAGTFKYVFCECLDMNSDLNLLYSVTASRERAQQAYLTGLRDWKMQWSSPLGEVIAYGGIAYKALWSNTPHDNEAHASTVRLYRILASCRRGWAGQPKLYRLVELRRSVETGTPVIKGWDNSVEHRVGDLLHQYGLECIRVATNRDAEVAMSLPHYCPVYDPVTGGN